MKLLFVMLLVMAGCSPVSGIIRELAKDPASACVTVVAMMGTVKVYRTNIANGSVVCKDEGMTVTSEGKK